MKRELFEACQVHQISNQGMDEEEMYKLLCEMGYINAEALNAKTLQYQIWQMISKDGKVLKQNLLLFLAAVTNTDIPDDEVQVLHSRHSE